jgi:hypothetical protein
MQPEVFRVHSLHQFIEQVQAIAGAWYLDPPGHTWFRGTAHPLLPGAVWARLRDEAGAMQEFVARAGGILPHEPADEWEWYFLLQHYGMATRLLDWTTNPLVAAYFALLSASTAPSPESVAHVWMLDPMKLNKASVGIEEVFTPGGELTGHWLPSRLQAGDTVTFSVQGCDELSNAMPLAILPRRRNPRILAQSGTFTLHGTDLAPLDVVMQRLPTEEQKIARIDFAVTPDTAGDLLRQLGQLGFSASGLFPEPEHLAREIRRIYAQG